MKRGIIKFSFFIFIIVIIILNFNFIISLGSSNYNISNPTFSEGAAGNSSSSNYKNNLIIEDFSSNMSSSSYKNYFGFWYSMSGNNEPNVSIVSINSSSGNNKTLDDLNCYSVISDNDNNTMNVSVRWHRNNVLNFSLDYNNSYANGTLFVGVLDDANTTKGENWSCGLRLYDGTAYSSWVNSTSLLILNSLPNVSLLTPANDNITTNRTPTFTWSGSDDDSDSIQYEFNMSLVSGSLCIDPVNRYKDNSTILGNTSYMVSSYLNCFFDNLDNYTWLVRAKDNQGYSDWTGSRTIKIQSDISISLPVNTINFGTLNMSSSEDTGDDSPAPLILRNDGNARVNITANFTNLWTTAPNPNSSYQFKIRNSTAGCFIDDGNTTTSWTNAFAPTITGGVIKKLNFTSGYQTGCNNVSVDLLVSVPSQEDPGAKSSVITFTSRLEEVYPSL